MGRRLLILIATLVLMFASAEIALAGSETTLLEIYKPAVGELDWGEEVNDNWDTIDEVLGSEHTMDGTHYNVGIMEPAPVDVELYVAGDIGASENLTIGGTSSISSDLTIGGTGTGTVALHFGYDDGGDFIVYNVSGTFDFYSDGVLIGTVP